MGKIIACIDGSIYADSVSYYSAWVSERTDLTVSLLHVVAPHYEVAAKGDMSGQIGISANSNLLDELSKQDEEHGKSEQRKGKLMFNHAKDKLAAKNIADPEIMHLRGTLVETIEEIDADADIIVMGKRGEHHQDELDRLGLNLESVARAIHKPLLVATLETPQIKKFLIAYDGSSSAMKALEYVENNPLLKGLECHILKVGEDNPVTQKMLFKAENRLKDAGYTVHMTLKEGLSVEGTVNEYIDTHDINLLLIGAYGHSKIFSLILGSTTTTLICKSNVPLLLFR